MDNDPNDRNLTFNPDTPVDLEFENGPDATGYWFAALVMFTALAAGLIVYRAANYDAVVALNDPLSAAPINPAAPARLIR